MGDVKNNLYMKRRTLYLIIILLVTTLFLFSCTENQRAKKYGGTATVKLPEGTKLIEATWKGEDLWYLYRPRRAGETIEIYTFKEESNFGVMEGKVIFKER